MMREQAKQKTEFQKIWAKKDRDSKRWWREHRSNLSTRSKRYTRREEENKAKNLEHLHKNREQIEAGQHWGWLRTIAHHYLYEPEKLSEVVDDIETAHKALRNCFPFLSGHVPTMEKLAMREGTAVSNHVWSHDFVADRLIDGTKITGAPRWSVWRYVSVPPVLNCAMGTPLEFRGHNT